MIRFFYIIPVIIALLAGCYQSGNRGEQDFQPARVNIILNNESVALTQPPLLRKDAVYVAADDLSSLPGIKIDYNQVTGEISTSRSDTVFSMRIGQPLKEGDKNGPRPFLNQDVVYIPFCDAISRLNYSTRTEKSNDGTLTVILEKMGFDITDIWKPFSVSELKAAEDALAKGITLDDPRGDWAPISEGIQPDGRSDNAYPYPLAFTDVRKIRIGADSKYLYLKVELDDVIPGKLVYYENPQQQKTDYIASMCTNLGLGRFFNRNTGKDDAGLMQLGVSFIEGEQNGVENPRVFEPPAVATSSFATVTGEKRNGEDVYAVSEGKGSVAGGPGRNYAVGAFTLSNFGLQIGDVIEFDISMEVGSKLFHHESVDVMLDCGYKAGETIRYRLGSDTYEKLGPPKNMLPLDAPPGAK
jgi:hypothetical protein